MSIPQFGNYNAPLVIVVCSYAAFIPWEDGVGVVDCCACVRYGFLFLVTAFPA
jgi:hypothetical protein